MLEVDFIHAFLRYLMGHLGGFVDALSLQGSLMRIAEHASTLCFQVLQAKSWQLWLECAG